MVREHLEARILFGVASSVPNPARDAQGASNRIVSLLNEYYLPLEPHHLLTAESLHSGSQFHSNIEKMLLKCH